MKIYTVIKTRRGNTSQHSGTMTELLKYYSYTLECGKSWEHEKGNSKINLTPKTGKSLIKQLNNAESNWSRKWSFFKPLYLTITPIKMKIIFLDIDGVISTAQCWGKGNDNKWDAYMFDPKCVAILNFILKTTGAEIVLSSDWKSHYTLFEMNEIFAHNGVIKGPISFTPSSKTYTGDNLEGGRVDEIKEWLKHHAWKNDVKWVAVDDLNMSEEYAEKLGKDHTCGLKNFVYCPKHMEGIKQTGVKEKILKFLE